MTQDAVNNEELDKKELDVEQLKARIEKSEDQRQKLEARNAHLNAEIDRLRKLLGLEKHRRFGPSSERTIDLEITASLFDEAEVTQNPDEPEPTQEELEEVTYKRRKAKGKRERDLEGLPVDCIRLELPEEERVCSCCSHPLHEIGSEDSDKLKYLPSQLRVERLQRVKYGCRHCERKDVNAGIVTTPMPPVAFPKSIATPSLVSGIISNKFELSLPLYRQEKYFQGLGFPISRANMANWMIRGAELLNPVYDHLRGILLKQDLAHSDDTRLQVLREVGRSAQSQSCMWVFCTGRYGPGVALYEYQASGAGAHPRRFLEGFIGYLHVDGDAVYNQLPDVKLCGCWAHARRKFHEALVALPPGTKASASPAKKGLEFCNRLYAVEKKFRDSTPGERLAARLEHSRPVLDEFRAWLDSNFHQTAPRTKVGEAIRYSLNQWEKLNTFLLDGRIEIDNNRCERAVKPFVIGRKNWLFANTPEGARSSAILYSIVETAKLNNVTPYSYLELLFERLPRIDTDDSPQLDELMPWSPSIQDAVVRVHKK